MKPPVGLSILLLILLAGVLTVFGLQPDAAGPLPLAGFSIVGLTAAWIGWFALRVESTRTDIAHILGIAYGLVVHPLWPVLGVALGMTATALLGDRETRAARVQSVPGSASRPMALLRVARSTLGITIGLAVYYLAGGARLTIQNPVPAAVPFLASAVAYSLCTLGLILTERRLYAMGPLRTRTSIALGMLIVIPLPVALLGATAIAILALPALLIYSLLIGIVAPFVQQTIRSLNLDQALRMRLVELEGLEQFAESLAIALTSQDLQGVILDQALQATRAQGGHLALFNKLEGKPTVVISEPPVGRDELHESALPIPEFTQRVVSSMQPLRSDAHDSALAPLLSERPQPYAVLGVPILEPGRALGALVVERYSRSPFTETDQSILVRIASQAAGAIRNARLYKELESRLTEQSLLYQASAQIAETLETEAVALATADGLHFALSAHHVAIHQWQPEDGSLRCLASMIDGRPVASSGGERLELQAVPCMQTCLQERKIQRWNLTTAPSERDRSYLEGVRHARSMLIVPLAVGQRTLGLLEITALEPDHFSEDSERIAQSIAIQAAIALENTGLFQTTMEGHDRLMAIMNSTREGMIMIDLSGRMLLVNRLAGEFVGLEHDLLEAHLITEPELGLAAKLGYEPDDLQRLLRALERGTTYFAGSAAFKVSEGDARFLLRSDSPVFDSDGNLIGWLIVLRDVTQERELQESRNLLTEMIVHDLRGPLTAILSGLTLLKVHIDDGSDSPIVKQALEVSERSLQQMLGLVNSLLSLSKLESGEARLKLEAADLAELVTEIVPIYLAEANSNGIIIETELIEAVPTRLDREMMVRVLSNLIDNALKFTPTGGLVGIRLARRGGQIELQVTDTGPGVPEEYRDRIFDRYAQIPGSSGRRRGTGLGLAFCKLAVDAHGGRIWVDDNPGGGSIFTLQLPIAGEPAQTT